MGFSLKNFKMDRRKFLGIFSASVFSALMPRKVSGKPDYRQNKNVPDNYIQNRETPGFYIRSANPFLGVDANNWALVVKGMVKNPVALAYEDLIGLPMVSQVSRLTQSIKGMKIGEVERLFEGFREMVTSNPQSSAGGEALGKLSVFSGVRESPMRVKCATLAWHAMSEALHDSGETATTE